MRPEAWNEMAMVIGHYKIIDKVGEGGMGVIYKAEHATLEQTVAIKALSPSFSSNSDLRERFVREARIQAKLSHPNVVNIHNFFEFEGNYYLVMEYVEGETLEGIIKTKGLISPDRCLQMFSQILCGVGYAHSKGIIHRDIKPSNIIVNPDGNIKITDFGIAKIVGDLKNTQTGIKMGTLWYMSPEQVKGQPAGTASDIYSLGITLFEMVTGTVPFTGDSEYSIMKQIVETSPPSPREFYPYIPHYLEQAISKAVAKEPGRRFKSTEEFAAALNNQDAEHDIIIRTEFNRAGRSEEDGGFLERKVKKVFVAAAVAAIAATVAGTYLLFSGGHESVATQTRQPSAEQRAINPTVAPASSVQSKPENSPSGLPKEATNRVDKHTSSEKARISKEATKSDGIPKEGSHAGSVTKKDQENLTSKRISELLSAAHNYHSNGRYGTAIDLFNKVLQLDESNHEARKGIEDAQSARATEERLGMLNR